MGERTRSRTRSGPERAQRAPQTSFELLSSKLAPPRPRSRIVGRSDLLDALSAADGAPIVSVVAPAGYGKTTLLAAWAERNGHAFAWVSLDEQDNDPMVLLTYVAAALDRIEPVDPAVFEALTSSGSSAAAMVIPRLARAFSSRTRPVVLVLDDAHLLHARECQAAVAVLADHVPAGSRIALASRAKPPLRLARLRAEGRVQEIGPEDLMLDLAGSEALLRDAGIMLPADAVTELYEKTEGWPVGLYLAAMSLRAGGSGGAGVSAFRGDDRFISEYLAFEVLSHQPAKQVTFLTRSAVLERMSGALCDAVLQDTGSAQMLEQIQRTNHLLVPLDRRGEWYRYHHLFREMLETELERTEPGVAAALRSRAAAWCEANGRPEDAVEYAIAASDEDTVARLVGMLTLPMHRAGRMSTVQRWFGWLLERGGIDRYPLVAVQASWLFALTGQAAAAERWAEAVDRRQLDGLSPEEASLTEALALQLQAAMCRRGFEAMRADAEEAIARFGSALGTPYLLRGIAIMLAGDADAADRAFEEAIEVNEALGTSVDLVLALAERSLLAAWRGAWEEAKELAEEARTHVDSAHLGEYSTTALVDAASSRVAVHRGDAEAARGYLVHAQRLRGQLTHALPYLAVQTRLELARAYVGLDEFAAARTLLREISEVLQRQPDLGVLVEQTAQLRSQLGSERDPNGGFHTLTTAELRLLPYLSTHLSFREIGEEFYLSPNTVKSQAISIYRKLGVSSRSDAIRQARTVGLLEG